MGLSEESFESWYRANASRLTAVLTVSSGDASLAADAVSESCARALARWNRVGAMADPSAWVYRVAFNELRRRHRSTRSEPNRVVYRAEPALPEARDLDLWREVAGLPQRMRTAVALRYLADMSEAQVAHMMGLSRGGVSSLLTKARAHLASRVANPYRPQSEGCHG